MYDVFTGDGPRPLKGWLTMNVHEWYGGLRMEMPGDFGPGFRRFVGQVAGFFGAVMTGEFDRGVRVGFTDNPALRTAAADVENGKIIFSTSLFSDEDRTFPEASVDEVLELVMGMTVHECLHFEHTTQTLENLCEFAGVEPSGLLGTVFNVVEDVFIDHEGYGRLVNYRWMTDSRLNTMFKQGHLNTLVEKLEVEFDVPTAVNAMTCLKNHNLTVPSGTDTWNELAGMVLSARGMANIHDRFRLAIRITDVLATESEDAHTFAGGSGNDDDGLPVEVESFVNPELVAAVVNGESGDFSVVDANVDGASVKFDDDLVTVFAVAEPRRVSSVINVPEYSDGVGFSLEVDERYVALSRLINARTVVNKPWGPQSNRGTHIRQLHRVATDGKVMTRRVAVDSVGPQEVVILVDYSASMASTMRFSGGKTRVENALSAAVGAARGLQAGRHRVAVYAHTADLDLVGEQSPLSCIVFELKEFGDDASVAERRAKWLLEFAGLLMANNADHAAVEFVAGKFSAARNEKTLIVISDGAPVARCYDSDGQSLTKRSVDKVRASGIRVVSISIAEDAKKPNNVIYGAANNTCHESPNVVAELLEKMFS